MFKKVERLSRSEFSEYFKTGKRHHFPNFTVITKSYPTRKVSVVVSKKVAKSAVRRNTIKRRVYATLRDELTEKGYQGVFIVIVKPNVNPLSRKVADELFVQSIAQVLKGA